MPEKATKKNEKVEELSESQVAEFLETHPAFFTDRDDLIEKLQLPHTRGDAVSLVERQVTVLRQRNIDARNQIEELLNSAKRNTVIFERCRRLILALVNTKSTDEFFQVIDKSLKEDFRCSAYHLLLFGPNATQINHFTSILPLETAKPHIKQVLDSREPLLGVLREELQDFLFRHHSNKVSSAAVVTLPSDISKDSSSADSSEYLGVLSIGSEDINYFEAGMGTLFLGFISDTIVSLLPHLNVLQASSNKGNDNSA